MPQRVQVRYSRAEIEAAHCFAEACGYGVLTADAPWIHREGVLWQQATQCDMLFVTLKKSEALFSPTTRYRDLALGPWLFHWESQSTTTAASATGQRYIYHEARGSRVLLFVREQRRQGRDLSAKLSARGAALSTTAEATAICGSGALSAGP